MPLFGESDHTARAAKAGTKVGIPPPLGFPESPFRIVVRASRLHFPTYGRHICSGTCRRDARTTITTIGTYCYCSCRSFGLGGPSYGFAPSCSPRFGAVIKSSSFVCGGVIIP